MTRSLGTALVAVIFTAALTGAADAKIAQQRFHTSAAVATAAHARAAAELAVLSEARVASEPAAVVAAGADMRMWGMAPSAQPRALHAKKSDVLHRFASGIINRTSSIAMSLTRNAMRFIGTPYVFGGTSTTGFDCSGYTQHVFAMLGIRLPRTADAQFYAGRPTLGGLTTGDLVFFQTYEPGPSHVGIYLGGGRFIHSSSHGVMISALAQSYWASRYLGAKRVANLR